MAPTTNLIVIIGGSGTGKTTLARALQERLLPDPWFHLSIDTLFYCLPKTIVDQADFANNWSAIDTKLITRLAYSCVLEALRSGARVVFDQVVMTERGARQLLDVFAASDPFLVGTTCAWDELVRRTKVRGDRTLEEVRRGFETGGKFLEPDCVVETTARSPAILVDELLKHLEHRAGASAWRRNLARYREPGEA
jgi:chloramphenicol 3-O phosphotransferase